MKNRLRAIALVTLGLLIAASLFFVKGNKFDTAESLVLSLITALLTTPLFLLLAISGPKKNIPSPIELFLLFGVIALLGLSYNASETKNFGFTEVLVTASAIVLYLGIRFSGAFSYRFLGWVTVLALASCLFGAFFYVTQTEPRIAGPFVDLANRTAFFPNAFALFLVMSWPLSLLFLKRNRWLSLLSMSVIITILVLTYSRGGWLSFMGQACILIGGAIMLFRSSPSLLKKFFVVGIGSVLLVYGLQSGLSNLRENSFETISLKERAQVNDVQRVTSVSERLDFFKGAMQLALEKPRLGYGPMSFGFTYRAEQERLLGVSDHPHNIILKMAAENGLPAALLFVLFLAFIGITTLQQLRLLPEEERWAALLLLTAIVGGMLHNMTDYNMNFLTNMLLWWMLAAFMLNISSVFQEKRTRISRILMIGVVGIMSVMIFRAATPEWRFHWNHQDEIDDNKIAYEESQMPRRFLLDRARNFIDNKLFDEADEVLLKHIGFNSQDAEAYNIIGETAYYQRKDYKKAQEYALIAIQKDPKNYFVYYKNYLMASDQLKDEKAIADIKPDIMVLLKEYRPLFEANVHYTSSTNNPAEVAWLHEFFDEKETAEYYRAEIDKLCRPPA